MTATVIGKQVERVTCLGDKVIVEPEAGKVSFVLSEGGRTRAMTWSADNFWETLADLSATNQKTARLVRGFATGKVVRDRLFYDGYLVDEGNRSLFKGREGRIDLATGDTRLPAGASGEPMVRFVAQADARIRTRIHSSDEANRTAIAQIEYFEEDGTVTELYSGWFPELAREAILNAVAEGAQVYVVPVAKENEVVIAVASKVTFFSYAKGLVSFENVDHEFWTGFGERATDSASEQAFQARLIAGKLWRVDPNVPDRVFKPDADLQFWCREGRINKESKMIRFESEDYGEYGGRKLFHPSVSGLCIVELCAEPGTYYGPWHIMKEDDEVGSYFVGCSAGDSFEDALKAVDDLLKLPEFPKPLPKWKKLPGADVDKNEGFIGDVATLDLEFFDGHKGKVTAHFSTLDDIWTETYTVEISKDGKALGVASFGENLGYVMKLRDNPEFFGEVCDSISEKDQSKNRKS